MRFRKKPVFLSRNTKHVARNKRGIGAIVLPIRLGLEVGSVLFRTGAGSETWTPRAGVEITTTEVEFLVESGPINQLVGPVLIFVNPTSPLYNKTPLSLPLLDLIFISHNWTNFTYYEIP